MSRFLPPSKVMNSDIVDSIIGDGCFIKDNATVRNSVVGLRSLIGANCVVEDTLMMGADYYETVDECR
jgi:glucose-1-phosphate adenylyltransferase